MKTKESRSGIDRRQGDFGPPGKLPERRRRPERRLPELTEISDISFEGFQLLLDGLPLLAMGSNRYFREGHQFSLDIGPFMAALEYAAELEAVVLGKPSPDFFLAAVNSLGLPPQDVIMVGDDAEMDVCGALAAGLRGALVRSGKYRPGDECKVEPAGGRVFDYLDAVVDYIL